MSTGTLSRTISFSAVATASFGLLLLSSTISSTFWPRMPPDSLRNDSAILAPWTT